MKSVSTSHIYTDKYMPTDNPVAHDSIPLANHHKRQSSTYLTQLQIISLDVADPTYGEIVVYAAASTPDAIMSKG